MSMFLLPDYRVRQRDFLLDISRALTSQLDLGEVLRMILSAATSMLAADVGLIALREQSGYHTRAVYGLTLERAEVFSSLLKDLSADETEVDIPMLHAKMRKIARDINLALRQVIAIPMTFGDDPLGILLIFRTYAGTPNENDRRLLQSFADQAAIAVNNARVFEFANHERQRLAAILDHSADGVMILDANLQVERWNRALTRITGLPQEQAVGRPHDVVIRWARREMGPSLSEALAHGWPYRAADMGAAPNGDPSGSANGSTNGAANGAANGAPNSASSGLTARAARRAALPAVSANNDTLYAEGDLARPDGSPISIGVTYAPLFNSTGDLVNIIGNVRDITHFREAERLKSTFISVISHELKTPVALIKGYADTLSRPDASWDQATVQNGLTVIEEEADRLNELIENLLAASKLQAEGMRLTLDDDVQLAVLAEQAIERFGTQTTLHTLRCEFPARFPSISADARRLRQVLDNLLSNAIKYSPNGGEIVVRGSATADAVRIDVSDQGPGLPPDQLTRVFERFYRVNNALTNNRQGTGLGLYLAHAVITAHGGKIWASNNPGGGATFSFTLPRQL